MSLLSNIDNVSYTSALQNDKILGDPITGSFSVGASGSPGSTGNIATTSISHAFGANVLPVMIFSTDNSSFQDGGSTIYTEGAFLDPNFSATCYTTSTTVVVIGQNFTGSTQTCYYKIVLISET